MPGASTGFSRPAPQVVGTLRQIQSEINLKTYQNMIENKNPAVVAFPMLSEETATFQGMPPPLLMEWSTIHKKWIPAPTPPCSPLLRKQFEGFEGNN